MEDNNHIMQTPQQQTYKIDDEPLKLKNELIKRQARIW